MRSKVHATLQVSGLIFLYFAINLLIQLFFKHPLESAALSDIIIAVAVLLFVRKKSLPELHLGGKINIGDFFVFLIIYSMTLFFGQVTGALVYSFGDAPFQKYLNTFSANPALALVLTLILAPIGEEMLMRRYVYVQLRRAFTPFVALITQAVLFAVMHGTYVHAYATFSMALLLGYVMERTGKVKYTIILHSLYNLISSLAGGYIAPFAYDGTLEPSVLVVADILCLFVIFKLYYDLVKPRVLEVRYNVEKPLGKAVMKTFDNDDQRWKEVDDGETQPEEKNDQR